MKPPLTILGIVVAAAGLSAQDDGPPNPFPRFMPDYRFHSSLATAINASGGKKNIVAFSVYTTTLRDRLQWLMQQRAIFSHPLTKKVLAGLPLVALRHDRGEGKDLRLPKVGLSILSPDGRRVRRTIDLSAVEYVKVPVVLADCLSIKIPETMVAVLDVRKELLAFQSSRDKILNFIESGDPASAEKICRAEEERSPDGFGPRLLRQRLRAKTLSSDYYRKLPADRPMLDSVCVVPDLATFLHVVESWGTGPIFPILYLDNHYLPLFLEAFRPAHIFIAKRVKAAKPTEAELFSGYAKAFGGGKASSEADAVSMWRMHEDHAPGVVLVHPDSPMAAAGLALAAGRRQLLAMMAPGNTKRRVSYDEMNRTRTRIRTLFTKHFLAAEQMYDDVDFITLASEQPFRYVDRKVADKTTYAVDDAIARDSFDFSFACVGRLMGGREQSLYMAMCSLFLNPEKSLLFSRYENKGSKAAYGTKRAAKFLAGKVPVLHVDHLEATLSKWNSLFETARNDHGLVHVNSSGSTRTWSTTRGMGSYDDLPLTVPTIVSYVHSNSLGDGHDSDTIGGRWLHNGAYSFFGSTHEPYLDAFVNIYAVYRRALEEGQPLGAAHRLLPLQLRWRPWKLMLYGDPMLRLRFGKRERQAALPKIWGVTTVTEAPKRNPFELEGRELELFEAQCLALRGHRATVATKLTTLLPMLRQNRGTLAAETRRATADLVAWVCLGGGGLQRLRLWIPNLIAANVDSSRLSYVAHSLLARRATQISRKPLVRGASKEIQQLAVAHVGFRYSPDMYKRIGELYHAILNKMPNSPRLKSTVKTTAKKQARDPKALQPFIRAL